MGFSWRLIVFSVLVFTYGAIRFIQDERSLIKSSLRLTLKNIKYDDVTEGFVIRRRIFAIICMLITGWIPLYICAASG